jgi:hypothetical protein
MSAQIISALRHRADHLDNEAASAAATGARIAPERTPDALRFLAEEMRIVADLAEGYAVAPSGQT